jgi:DNA polymerase I-like protein with 3'-5' exonuclease and polymerase domains
VAAAVSGDKELNATFEKSDPYTVMANDLEIDRDECKIAFLRAIYSLDAESPILELFPTFKEWMYDQIYRLSSDGFLQTPLGRKFKLGSRDEKSVFNAVLQGTVAHAMQSSLSRMISLLGEHLLTETHDSVVLVGRPGIIPHIVKAVVDIMFEPLERFPTFPLRVYVGKVWKKWKLYKEYR